MRSSSPDKTPGIISLSVSEIIQRAGNNAYFQAKAMEGKSEESKALLADIGQEENAGRTMQIIELAVHEFYAMIFDLQKYDVGIMRIFKDKSEIPDRFDIRLSVPVDFPETALYSIGIQAQEYVVCKVMNDWCNIIIQPDLAAVWATMASNAEAQIKKMLLVRGNKKRYISCTETEEQEGELR